MAGNKREYGLEFQIGAKVSQEYSRAFAKAQKDIAAFKKQVAATKKAWGAVGASFAKTTGLIVGAGAAIAGAAFKTADATAKEAFAIANTSQKLGIHTKDLQELRYWYEQNGNSATEFDSSLEYMRRTLAKLATDQNAAAKFYEQTGLSARALFDMEPERAIERIADYMNALPDAAQRSTVAVQLFGRGASQNMVAAMAEGSAGIRKLKKEFEETGAGLDDEAMKQAAIFATAKNQLTTTFRGIRNTIGAELMPAFSDVFKELSKSIQASMPAIREFAQGLGPRLKDAVPVIKEIAVSAFNTAKQIWRGVEAVKDFVGGWGNLTKLAIAFAFLPTALKTLNAVWQTGKLIAAAYRAVPAVITTAKIAMTGMGKGFTVVAAIATKLKLAIGGVAIATKAAIITMLPVIGIVAGIAVAIAAVWLAVKHWDKIKAFAGNVWNSVKTGAMAAFNKVKEYIGVAVDYFRDRFPEAFAFVTNIFNSFKQMVGGIFEAISGVVKTFVGVFTGDWEKAGEGVKQVWDGIKKYLTGWIDGITGIFKPLFEFWEKSFGRAGSFIKGIFGGAKNDAKAAADAASEIKAPSGSVPAYATGGRVTSPHLAVVGDAPEYIIPEKPTARSVGMWKELGQKFGMKPQPATSGVRPQQQPTGLLTAAQDGIGAYLGRLTSIMSNLGGGVIGRQPAATSGETTSIAPVININITGTPSPQQIKEIERAGTTAGRNFAQEMAAYKRQEARLSWVGA